MREIVVRGACNMRFASGDALWCHQRGGFADNETTYTPHTRTSEPARSPRCRPHKTPTAADHKVTKPHATYTSCSLAGVCEKHKSCSIAKRDDCGTEFVLVEVYVLYYTLYHVFAARNSSQSSSPSSCGANDLVLICACRLLFACQTASVEAMREALPRYGHTNIHVRDYYAIIFNVKNHARRELADGRQKR